MLDEDTSALKEASLCLELAAGRSYQSDFVVLICHHEGRNMSFRKCVTRDAPEKKFLASLHGLKLCGTTQSYGVLYIFKLGWWPLWPQYN